MNIRDERTVGEQVWSGFRLAGWILLTIAFIFTLLVSTSLVIGKGDTKFVYRVLAGVTLIGLSVLLFITVRRWVKWLIGALAYIALKLGFSLMLGFSLSVPTIFHSRALFFQWLIAVLFAIIVCFRYLTHQPHNVESIVLVGFVIALSLSATWDSYVPVVAGAALLAVVQLLHLKRVAPWH